MANLDKKVLDGAHIWTLLQDWECRGVTGSFPHVVADPAHQLSGLGRPTGVNEVRQPAYRVRPSCYSGIDQPFAPLFVPGFQFTGCFKPVLSQIHHPRPAPVWS